MPFLSANGIELPVAPDSFEERVREVGFTGPAYSGALRKTRRAVKRDCTFETPPMLASDALAWDMLLRGMGEAWSFDSHLYGSKGTGPSSNTATQSAGTAKHGAGCLRFSGAQAIAIPVALDPSLEAYSVMYWRRTDAAGTYVHYIHNHNTGAESAWVNGVFGMGPEIFTPTASSVAIEDSDSRLDDLVILPFSVPEGWVLPLYAEASARAFFSLPRLRISGDAVSEASSRTCIGDVSSSRLLQGVVGGAWHTNLRKLSVTLSEV
jgi:hypothetical protein